MEIDKPNTPGQPPKPNKPISQPPVKPNTPINKPTQVTKPISASRPVKPQVQISKSVPSTQPVKPQVQVSKPVSAPQTIKAPQLQQPLQSTPAQAVKIGPTAPTIKPPIVTIAKPQTPPTLAQIEASHPMIQPVHQVVPTAPAPVLEAAQPAATAQTVPAQPVPVVAAPSITMAAPVVAVTPTPAATAQPGATAVAAPSAPAAAGEKPKPPPIEFSNGTPWIKNGVKTYFQKPTELVNLLEPLIVGLEWGGDYRQLIEALPHFSDDLDLTEFLNVMATIGYNNESTYLSLRSVPEKYMPCLFIPTDGAAMVILSKTDDGFRVVDGTTGSELDIKKKHMLGTVYHFTVFDADKAVTSKQATSFNESFHRFRPLIGQIFLLTLMYNIFMATVPIYIMLIYDKVIPSESFPMLISFLIGILIFVFSAQLLAVARIKIVAYIGARLDKTIGESIIRHLLYLPPSYTEGNTVGVQIARIKSFDNIRDFFTSNIAIMACEFPFAAVFLALMFYLGGWLGFVPIILGLIFYAIYHIANPIVNKYIKIQAAQNMLKQTFLLESFIRVRDIKETGRTEIWEEKFDEMLIRLSKNGFDNSFYNSNLGTVSELFMMMAALAMLVFGALSAMKQDLSLGILIAIMMLTWKVLNPLKSFFSSLPKIEQIQNSIVQVNRLFSIPSERSSDRKVVPVPTEKSKIEFNRVTFKYRPELAPAILGISFVVNPGELICVTGKNSAGKSTLLRLILGLYKPQAGSILINDMNVQQFDPIELRHTIAYMPQNVQLFYGTIKQNILFGNMISTEEQVIAAAKMANVHEEIMRLPEQYGTRVGDQKSAEFSATFLQKIALARTYLKNSKIILFDEPANGFDYEDEKHFLEVMNEIRKNATILWVTHRPSHLKIANKIIYMENGEVALFGEASKVLERLPRSLI